jgi:hypothetical protein
VKLRCESPTRDEEFEIIVPGYYSLPSARAEGKVRGYLRPTTCRDSLPATTPGVTNAPFVS